MIHVASAYSLERRVSAITPVLGAQARLTVANESKVPTTVRNVMFSSVAGIQFTTFHWKPSTGAKARYGHRVFT